MTPLVRIIAFGPFRGLIGRIERPSASGGLWVRIEGDWPADEPDLFGRLMFFERMEVEAHLEKGL